MLATVCWAQPLGQPEILILKSRASLRYSARPLLKDSEIAVPRPLAEAIPRRHVSDPGQVVTSTTVPTPSSPTSICFSEIYRESNLSSLTQGRKIFCPIEVLNSPAENSRAIFARLRARVDVMSPNLSRTCTPRYPSSLCSITASRAQL